VADRAAGDGPALLVEEVRRRVVPILAPFASRIALFGSLARGDSREDSDVDLLVRLRPPGQRPALGLRWFGLETELAALLGRRVDLVSEDALSPHIRRFAEQALVVVYDEG
jgi:predicted nucleotidyltransferase